MSVEVTHSEPAAQAGAREELTRQGLHVMELNIPPVKNDSHWHSFDAVFYVTQGRLLLTDVASGGVHDVGPGDRVAVPARTLHAEESSDGYSILLGTSRAPDTFEDPVNLPPDQLGN